MDDNDLATVDSLQVDGGNPEISVAKLALDHVEGDALACHFNGRKSRKGVTNGSDSYAAPQHGERVPRWANSD